MKIKALAPWFGGKRNLAPKIVELLGKHRVYWEPFCGSCAVLMAKPACVMETVNDLHADIINLARVIQDEQLGPQLYRKLRRTLMHEQLFHEAAARYRKRGYYGPPAPDLDLPRAFDFMLCTWLGRNGVGGTQSYNQGYCVRYTASGGHAARRFISVTESIPAWRRRLRHVTIIQRDAFALLEKIDDRAGTAIYIDPPYIEKGAKYIHDFEPEDHERLAKLLNRFTQARVVVSYYAHPQLKELYPDWHFHRINVTKSLSNQNKRGRKNVSKKVVEVLLTNDKSEETLF